MSARVLVVDDEESIRYTFQSFLMDEGHDVVAVSSCMEAAAEIAEKAFDLILADMVLADGTGINVLQEVRRRDLRWPVVLTTGFLKVETALTALHLGVFDYLQKPVRQQTLLTVTQQALSPARGVWGEAGGWCSNLRAVLERARDALVAVDRDGVVLAINEAALGRCGLTGVVRGKIWDPPRQKCSGCCRDILEQVLERQQKIERRENHCGRGQELQQIVTLGAWPLLTPDGKFSGSVLMIREHTGAPG